MARIAVVGSVASDEIILLSEPLREGGHFDGRAVGPRLGGGGANTAVALAAAGHDVVLVGAVGADEAGAWQIRCLRDAGIDVSAMVRLPGASTRSLLLIDPDGERTIVNLTRIQESEAPERLSGLGADLVYVRSRVAGLGALLSRVAEATMVVAHVPPLAAGGRPAQVVLGSASDLDGAIASDPLPMAQSVAGRHLRWVVVTRGAGGSDAVAAGGQLLRVPAAAVERVVDTTGAGDSFAAGLCHVLSGDVAAARAGDPALMAAALAEGARWGAAKVGCAGSALPPEVVRALMAFSAR